ncbi:unnamed protein product [Oreochromis niloticus]|nr:unnamed protein product [Mustela putorius furo]
MHLTCPPFPFPSTTLLGPSRLHLLRRLRSFGVNRMLLRTFYDTVVASAIFCAVVCCSGGMAERDTGKLNKLVRRVSSVLDCPLKSIEQVGEERMLSKLTSIMDNTSHPLHETTVTSRCAGKLQMMMMFLTSLSGGDLRQEHQISLSALYGDGAQSEAVAVRYSTCSGGGPTSLTLSDETAVSMVISWVPPNAHVLQYHVSYTALTGADSQDHTVLVPGGEKQVMLESLQPDARYSILVTAEYHNREGGSGSAQGKTAAQSIQTPLHMQQ